MSKYKLYFFNCRGKGEVIRQMFAYGDVDYEDIRIEEDEWPNFKPKMPFGKVPTLDVDGKLISQSGAIIRLVAKTVGLYGRDDIECAEIDMIVDYCDEIFQFALPMILYETDSGKKAAAIKKCGEDIMPDLLDRLEKQLQKTNGFFVGGRMTVADLRLVNDIQFPMALGVGVNLEKYPHLSALEEKVTSHPKIAAWIAKRPITSY